MAANLHGYILPDACRNPGSATHLAFETFQRFLGYQEFAGFAHFPGAFRCAKSNVSRKLRDLLSALDEHAHNVLHVHGVCPLDHGNCPIFCTCACESTRLASLKLFDFYGNITKCERKVHLILCLDHSILCFFPGIWLQIKNTFHHALGRKRVKNRKQSDGPESNQVQVKYPGELPNDMPI